MKELTLDGLDRVYLFRVLPANMGSLEESLLTKALRERIITEDFKESINWAEKMGQLNFDIRAAEEHPEQTFEFDESECEVIAYGFLHDEQSGEVPTDDRYLELYHEFKPFVEDIKS